MFQFGLCVYDLYDSRARARARAYKTNWAKTCIHRERREEKIKFMVNERCSLATNLFIYFGRSSPSLEMFDVCCVLCVCFLHCVWGAGHVTFKVTHYLWIIPFQKGKRLTACNFLRFIRWHRCISAFCCCCCCCYWWFFLLSTLSFVDDAEKMKKTVFIHLLFTCHFSIAVWFQLSCSFLSIWCGIVYISSGHVINYE